MEADPIPHDNSVRDEPTANEKRRDELRSVVPDSVHPVTAAEIELW